MRVAGTIRVGVAVLLAWAAMEGRPACAQTTQRAAPEPLTEAGVKDVMARWTEVAVIGDEATTRRLLFDDGSPEYRTVLTMLLATTAQARLMATINEVFGDNTVPLADSIASAKKEAQKANEGVTVKIVGNGAEVTTRAGQVNLFVYVDGEWKVDFAGTTRRNRRQLPDKAHIDHEEAKAAIFLGMIPEIKAHKFKTFKEAESELGRRIQQLPDLPEIAQLKAAATQVYLSAMNSALTGFKLDNGRFPTTEEGLAALAAAPASLKDSWKGPYWNETLKDPWGNAVIYENPNAQRPSDLILYSVGPDGKKDTPDDVRLNAAPTGK